MIQGYQAGLVIILVSGFVFLIFSLTGLRSKVAKALPDCLKKSIPAGIGLFSAFIGFQNAKVIGDDQFVLVSLIDFTKFNIDTANAIVCLVGLFIIAVLDKLNVKGSIIIGVLSAALLGIPLGVTDLSILAGNGAVSWKFWENFANFFAGENSVFLSFVDVFKEGLVPEGGSVFTVIMVVITMCMIDMFDTMGTIVGCCGGNRVLSDENNKPYNYDKIMISDSVATCAGAMLGTSTVTTFVESGAGVSAGGRTGMTSLTTAVMFFLAMFAMPAFAVIPGAATAAALIYVGVLMMKNNIKSVDMDDAISATSAFLTIVVMLLSYSITKGIGIGMVTYTVMSLVAYLISVIKYAIGKKEKPVWNVSVVALVVTALFCVYFFVPVAF